MAARAVYLCEAPGDPNFAYLKAALFPAPDLRFPGVSPALDLRSAALLPAFDPRLPRLYPAEDLLLAERVIVPSLTENSIPELAAALHLEKTVFLPAEAAPGPWSPAARRGLAQLMGAGLILCPLTRLPRWVATGVSCRELLTLERLEHLAAQGFDRIYLAGVPAATPLARQAAKRRNIHLMGVSVSGTGKGDRLGVVYAQEQRPDGQ